MSRFMWRLKLSLLLLRYGYVARFSWREAWNWTAAEEWEMYRADGFSAYDAIREDASYGFDG